MRVRHNLIVAVVSSCMLFCSPLFADWWISLPNGGTFSPNSVISGSGTAQAFDVGYTAVFSFGKADVVQGIVRSVINENTVNVTAVSPMPGMVTWQTAIGQFAPPSGGWSLSKLVDDHYEIDHAAKIQFPIPGTGGTGENFSNPCVVAPP